MLTSWHRPPPFAGLGRGRYIQRKGPNSTNSISSEDTRITVSKWHESNICTNDSNNKKRRRRKGLFR